MDEKDIRLFSTGGKWRHNRRERNERGDFGLLGLQVSSFGYEIYDVHMPHSIPLLKEGVKREKILRIMVFDGCERPVLSFLGISVGYGHGNLYVEVVVTLSGYEIAFQRTNLPDAHLVSATGKV